MSRGRLSPIITASPAVAPIASSAAVKMRGSGFPTSISAEMTIVAK